MARDRNRMDDQLGGPERGPQRDMDDERMRGGVGDDLRGVADEGDEEFEDIEDTEEEEDEDASY